jgi:hypothetical protein
MSTIVNTPLRSKFGYESPSFTVDSTGNITARSITLDVSDDDNVDVAADFKFQDTASNFRLIDSAVTNPSITIVRNTGNTIDLDLTNFTFNIFDSVGSTVTSYNSGLRHSDGTVDSDAQGKASGRLYITPMVATPNILYYGNAAGTIYGIINVVDPTGVFGTVAVNSTTESTSSSTGALTVAGGLGVAGDLYVAGSLNIDGVGITKISSSTNLELEATNQIVVKIDGSNLGIIKSTGSSVPVEDTTINNTTIGAIVPSTAAFTSATVSTEPAELNAVANKKYVDRTATALSIAFGL